MTKSEVKLGDTVIDDVTGLEGIAICKIEYLHGCEQFGIQAKLKDGKIPKVEYIDTPQLKHIIKTTVKKHKDNTTRSYGGMRDHPE